MIGIPFAIEIHRGFRENVKYQQKSVDLKENYKMSPNVQAGYN